MPVNSTAVSLQPHDGGTRMVATSVFASADALQQVLDMGMSKASPRPSPRSTTCWPPPPSEP